MTTTAINTGNPTLLDVIKRTDPNGAIASVVEMLSKESPLIEDATFIEGNLPTGHRVTARTALPSVGWRMFNEGVAASKSRTDQFDETCGMLEGHSIVDCELAELNGNKAQFRATEDSAFMDALTQELETGMFYHSTKLAPEKFMGLSPRLDSLSGDYNNQIINCQISSSGSDQTSIWFVVWGPETVFAIYPKDSKGGISYHDMGEQMVTDSNSKRFRAYETVWNWKVGLCVKDARYVVRLANIDTSAIVGTGKLLLEDMIKAFYQLKDVRKGRPVIYANRTMATYLHLQAQDTVKNSTLTIDNIGGQPITRFLGIPIRVTDALLNSEDVIS